MIFLTTQNETGRARAKTITVKSPGSVMIEDTFAVRFEAVLVGTTMVGIVCAIV